MKRTMATAVSGSKREMLSLFNFNFFTDISLVYLLIVTVTVYLSIAYTRWLMLQSNSSSSWFGSRIFERKGNQETVENLNRKYRQPHLSFTMLYTPSQKFDTIRISIFRDITKIWKKSTILRMSKKYFA